MAVVNPVQVQKFLSGIDYPATKERLTERAQQEGADEKVLEALQKLPEKEYESPTAVSKAIAGEEG